jgi:hypothetical protein
VKGKILSEPLATDHDFLPILDNFFWGGLKFYERKRKYFFKENPFFLIRIKAETSSTLLLKKSRLEEMEEGFGTTEVLVHKKK